MWLPLSTTAGSLSPLPQTGHSLPGQGCRALTSLSPLPITSCQEAQVVSEGRKGRTEQCLPEMTVTGTGSQHSSFINLRTTESEDTSVQRTAPHTWPPGTLHPCRQQVQPQDSREVWNPQGWEQEHPQSKPPIRHQGERQGHLQLAPTPATLPQQSIPGLPT